MGRITRDLELKTTPAGVSVLSFSLAVERDYVAKGEERQTDFINCVAWRNTAEFISRFFAKGSLILVAGQLQTRKYQNKDGNNVTVTEVVVDKASFTGEKKQTASAGAPTETPTNEAPTAPAADEEYPF
jgi:single-strand DNA-binding protein